MSAEDGLPPDKKSAGELDGFSILKKSLDSANEKPPVESEGSVPAAPFAPAPLAPVGPVASDKPAESFENVEPAEPVTPAETTRPAEQISVAEPSATVRPVEPVQAAETFVKPLADSAVSQQPSFFGQKAAEIPEEREFVALDEELNLWQIIGRWFKRTFSAFSSWCKGLFAQKGGPRQTEVIKVKPRQDPSYQAAKAEAKRKRQMMPFALRFARFFGFLRYEPTASSVAKKTKNVPVAKTKEVERVAVPGPIKKTEQKKRVNEVRVLPKAQTVEERQKYLDAIFVKKNAKVWRKLLVKKPS